MLKQEVVVHRSYKGEPTSTSVINLQHPNQEANFALSLLGRWGLVAAIDDGEDSAGRTRLKLATVEESIERAFAIARLAYSYIEEKQLYLTIPNEAEREAICQDRDNRRENGKK